MRDFFHGGMVAAEKEPFLVFGSKMSSNLRQDEKQSKSKEKKFGEDKLDFAEMLSKESMRLTRVARA